ncbi:MAG TPA: LacI family DNA-binding transcriptional regulator [Anaerolineales bacterium]|nr:LacI family DNA-binding transcriptional regulator [Anaerolineales bacterium]
MANIRDVAKLAGVAPITVSRCINNSGYCSEATRARVEAAIAELGFVPNRLATGLRSKRTNTLALVLTDITNPFFTTIARGVEDIASEAGYTVIFCNTDESISKEQMYLQMLLEKRVDGILLVPALSGIDSVNLVKKQGTPIVLIDRRLPGLQTDVVRCDSEGGAYELTRLLISLGHREIALLDGPKDVSTSEDRKIGYRKALTEAGISNSARLEQFGAFTQESGFDMTKKLFSAAQRPTAVFAANNFIAIGALKALQELGLRVPEDVALVGFDDLPVALVTFPFLTVAAQPAYEMGTRAMEILLNRLSGKASEQFQEVVLPAELVIRRSSGIARNR